MEKKKRGRPFGIYTPIKLFTQEEKKSSKNQTQYPLVIKHRLVL